MQYYFSIDGTTQQGPLDAAGLRSAGVGPTTMVWREGMPEWQPAGSVPDLAGMFPPTVNPAVMTPPPAGPRPQQLPPQQPGYQGPVGHPGGPPVGSNGMAVASLVCGLVGLTGFCCCIPFIVSILAVIFGHIARGQIKRGFGSGDGYAVAGLVLGYLGIL
ncbi:MAG: hypothetical protein JWM57_2070, partial [Phycisphaerales bacterium]|nr:hypothetical protein [Phycisphaerales bacterium]